MIAVSGLKWIQAVRDSEDIVLAAKAIRYRRDRFADPDAPKYVAPQTVKLVALAIGSFMDAEGVARVSYETLRQRFKFSPVTARAAVFLLIRTGWLVVEPGGGAGHTNRYLAQIPRSAWFYKSGCAETASERGTSHWESKSGLPATTKKVEEELRLGGEEEGTHTQVVGEETSAGAGAVESAVEAAVGVDDLSVAETLLGVEP